MPENVIINTKTNSDGSLTLILSRPILTAPADGRVTIDYLKYLPLFPFGSVEFNNTMMGWMRYVKTATKAVKDAGVNDFSVEIWNELTFGSEISSISIILPPTAPPFPRLTGAGDSLHPGGSSWELANQTTQYLKRKYGNHVHVIWGFSNTTFYHTPPYEQPPNTDGESFHPYATNLSTLAASIPATEYMATVSHLVEGTYVPNVNIALPESIYALNYRLESLIPTVLTPDARESKRPHGTSNFLYYITETGVNPAGDGVKNDDAEAQLIKAKSALREYSFWLNKGISQFDLYAAFDNAPDDGGFGLLSSRF